ncbi:hypothetical protein [Kineococcus sp. SYSU DK004]|uniref:hypothetical protein n=1 Tax=Kineococcus sp. SYSU DK004 TaxID=3383125 RepID=UPI003D7E693F
MDTPAPHWLLVPPAEVGILERLRPAVRATRSGVLVRLDAAPPVPGAQLGIAAPGPGRRVGEDLQWFGGGLTAVEVGALVAAVRRGDVGAARCALAHRRLGAPAAGDARPDHRAGRPAAR